MTNPMTWSEKTFGGAESKLKNRSVMLRSVLAGFRKIKNH